MNRRAERLLKMWPRFLHDIMEVPREDIRSVIDSLSRGGVARKKLLSKYPRLRVVQEASLSVGWADPTAIFTVTDDELRFLMAPTAENYGVMTCVEDQLYFMELLLEQLRNPSSFLDVGCGASPYTIYLGANGYLQGSIVGVDSCIEALHRSRVLMARANFQHELVHAHGFQLPFCDESFEHVFCNDSLHWMKGWRKAVSELVRVLASDGQLYLNYSTAFPRAGINLLELRQILSTGGVEFEEQEFSAEISETPRCLIIGTKK